MLPERNILLSNEKEKLWNMNGFGKKVKLHDYLMGPCNFVVQVKIGVYQ